ncbi:MAG: DUF3667 domain-containing protein [Bacteroidetes bacterium]|nr:DUF3667 domain-containing protein [Bacteroidota bacterium]MBI3481460.1 DUF3667 domain-containing protein [Bacteroidota bacterium]
MHQTIIPEQKNLCLTCGTKLKGNYCSHCGEKKLNPTADYSIHKFIEQSVDGFTHFDSKFLRSFRALLFKPGLLTVEFIHGRRMRYMKPVQIFIIASVLFYFFFPKASTFFAPVAQLQLNNRFGFNATKVVQDKATADSTTTHLIIKAAETEAVHKSKAYLFILIPFWGLLFYLLFWRSNPFLVPHVILAAHSLSFFIVLFMIYYPVMMLVGLKKFGDNELILMAVIFLTYLFFSIKRVYQQSIFLSLVKSILALLAFMTLFATYREGITIWVLST